MKSSNHENSKKTLLLLAYYYPPIKAISVLRSYYFSQFVAPYFSDIHIITTSNQRRLPKENLPNIADTKIHEALTFDYRTLSTLRPRTSVSFKEETKKNAFIKFAIKLNKSFPTTLIWGEGGLIYIIHSFFIAFRLIKKHDIQTIYSSYLPYSDHFIAYLLKIIFPKLIWIADFRDLHVEPHYDIVYWRPFQHWCNRQILKKANLVTTVSEGLAQHLRDYHKNVYVFHNGIAPLSIEQSNPSLETDSPKKFTISYTGSMYGDERNPRLLLEVLTDLRKEGILTTDNFQLVYAGKDTQVWIEWLNRFNLIPFFVSHGMVSLSDAKRIQSTSHINLLLTSATPEWTGVMTGKFYEYLAAQQPIVVLINGTQDVEFETIVSNLNAGCVVYNDRSHAELRRFILMLFSQFEKNGKIEPMILTDKLKELEWDSSIQRLMERIGAV